MKPTVATRDTIQADLSFLAKNLRKADVDELQAGHGMTPEQALEVGRKQSSVMKTMFRLRPEDNKWWPIAAFGVVPDLDAVKLGTKAGAVWLVGTPEIFKAPKDFHRQCRKWVKKFHETYETLWNWVDARNARHVAWLMRLGFRFVAVDPNYNGSGKVFLFFVRTREED